MATLPYFSAIFTLGHNFCDLLFASLDIADLPNWGLLLKNEFILRGETENGRVARNDNITTMYKHFVIFLWNRTDMTYVIRKSIGN